MKEICWRRILLSSFFKGYEIYKITSTAEGWIINGKSVDGAEQLIELTLKNAGVSRLFERIEDLEKFLNQRVEEKGELRDKLNNLKQVISFISDN